MGEKPKFKVGDRVEVIQDTTLHGAENGTRLTIARVDAEPDDSGQCSYRVAERGYWYYERDLKLVERPNSNILNKYHFFHSESNPLDIQRVADENPEAIGGVVLAKASEDVVVWLRQEFIDKFDDSDNIVIAEEILGRDWGFNDVVRFRTPDAHYHSDNGYYRGIRRWWADSPNVPQVISEIKAAKKFLADKEANMKKAEEEQKEETKVKPKEPRTKITVLTF